MEKYGINSDEKVEKHSRMLKFILDKRVEKVSPDRPKAKKQMFEKGAHKSVLWVSQ